HDKDQAYTNVILHVVEHDDCRIIRSDGSEIPQVVMPCARDFSARYHEIVDRAGSDLGCSADLPFVPGVYVSDWITSLAFERLYARTERIRQLCEVFRGDWGSVIYVVLARALGFGTNSDAFERLALRMPLRKLQKHCDELVTVEGALFGQAGLLDGVKADKDENYYIYRMKEEHAFMAAKFGLDAPMSPGWRMGRMRPQNFPHRRIATLASMVHDGFPPGYNLLHVKNEEEARQLFRIDLNGYWSRRYNFGQPSAPGVRALSEDSITTLVINVVVPVLFAYGTVYGDEDMCGRALEMLQGLKPENNRIVRLFRSAGIRCDDAFASQALIELWRSYCEPRKCLYCRFGHRILAQKAIQRPCLAEPECDLTSKC
ncbi:MAG: DUF2851 family protein, partial [Muribaculaceae bacterium]|nr:DUF2851 family protein [Muribaculaceae bacterium]